MTTSTLEAGDPGVEREARLARAFANVTGEIRAVKPAEFAVVNIDVYEAVATVLSAIPRLRELRPAIAAITTLDLETFDALEERALALAHAQGAYLVAISPRTLEETAKQANEARDLLLTDARALANRKLIPVEPLVPIEGRSGFRQVASDLIALVHVLRDNWSKVQGKTAITLAELENAEVLAHDLLVGAGDRARSQKPGEAHSDRLGAFTLFLRSYKHARRMIEFLRYYEGDADEILPSLHASKGRRKAQTPIPTDDGDSDDGGDGDGSANADGDGGTDADSSGTAWAAPSGSNSTSPHASGSSVTPATAAARSPASVPRARSASQAAAPRGARAQASQLQLGEEFSSDGSGMEGLPGVDPFKD